MSKDNKKLLVEKTLLKIDFKTKLIHSCSFCNDSGNYKQIKKRVTDKYFEKKLDFEPKLSSVTGKVCYHYNTWMTGANMAYMFDRN